MLSACWLIGAYFLAVSSHKRGRLNTSVYGSLKVEEDQPTKGMAVLFYCQFLALITIGIIFHLRR